MGKMERVRDFHPQFLDTEKYRDILECGHVTKQPPDAPIAAQVLLFYLATSLTCHSAYMTASILIKWASCS